PGAKGKDTSCPTGYFTVEMLTGSAELSFKTVGMSNSDFGLLELMWNSLPTRKSSCTVAELPALTCTVPTGAIVTDGTWFPGSCENTQTARRDARMRTAHARLIARWS